MTTKDLETAPDEGKPAGAAPTGPDAPAGKRARTRLLDVPEIVMLSQSRSVSAEKFRRLKTILTHDPEGGPQVIVVTSAAPNEGKTLVSTNLALAFAAERGGTVLLVDADLRRPSVSQWLTPDPPRGLSEVLRRKEPLDRALLELENSSLRVLPAGEPPRDPVELLSSEFGRSVFSDLRRRFRRIVIDTPPIVPFADADVLGAHGDGILVVARAGTTPRRLLLQAISAVTSTRVLGMVLNDTTYSLADRDSYYRDKQYYKYYEKGRGK